MANLFDEFVRKHLVDTVPEAMDLCLSCQQVRCGPEAFRQCAPRLARARELLAADAPPVVAMPARAGRRKA